jgi:hypothetical protein
MKLRLIGSPWCFRCPAPGADEGQRTCWGKGRPNGLFSKKRKKLLSISYAAGGSATASQKSFASFLQKRRPFFVYATAPLFVPVLCSKLNQNNRDRR